jgi:tetrahydromethanopterin S-methyltransferase subunit G
MSRYYGRISIVPELKAIQDQASLEGKTAVGVTKGGGLYAIKSGKAEKVAIEEAAKFLETSTEEVQKLVDAKGVYEIKDPEPELEIIEEPVTEPTQDSPSEPVVDLREDAPEEEKAPEAEAAEDEKDEVHEKLDEILAISRKANKILVDIPETYDSLTREVRGLRADIGRLINKLEKIVLE